MRKNLAVASPGVLAEHIWPGTSVVRGTVLTFAGAMLLALAAQIEIPLIPVPITGQTFGVLVVGALLGSGRGTLSVLAYLAAGAAGLPVFAGGGFGMITLLGPTGGYLLGFVPAAFLVGFLCERGWDRKVWTTAIAMTAGTCLIYAFGALGLARFVGGSQVLTSGVLPFIPGDVGKIALATLVLPSAHKLIGPPTHRRR